MATMSNVSGSLITMETNRNNSYPTYSSSDTERYHRDLETDRGSQVDLISDKARRYLDVVFYVIVLGTVSMLGSAGNVINILVFVKQGLKDGVTCSLMALTVSDLASLLALSWMSICYLPEFRFSDIPFESFDVQYLTACWPHGCFARITSCITAYITVERCMCTAIPFKVKTIITRKRTIVILILIFVCVSAIVVPVVYAIRLVPIYFPHRNKTLIGLMYIDRGIYIEGIAFSTSVGVQLSSFIVVSISGAILIQSLLRNAKWKRTESKSAISGSSHVKVNRDKRVAILVATISCTFVACYTPSVANLILMLSFPDYAIVGKYSNTFIFAWSFFLSLEAINSSVSIFIYYNMSSKFRVALITLKCPQKLQSLCIFSRFI